MELTKDTTANDVLEKAPYKGDTYRDLLNYHTELQSKSDSIFFRFQAGKVKEFWKNNSVRINSMIKKLSDINPAFFEFEGENIKRDEKQEAIFIEGKTQSEYEKERNLILDEPCNIIF